MSDNTDPDKAIALHSHAVPDEPTDEHVPIVKAAVIGVEIEEPKSKTTPSEKDTFGPELMDIVPYPLPEPFSDPQGFVDMWLTSAVLQPPIDAYSTDVHGLGHDYVPTVDLDAEDILDRLREAHELRRVWLAEFRGKKETELPKMPDDDALKGELEDLRRQAKRERLLADIFFGQAVRESTFEKLRITTCGQESETGGNWYWEVIRTNGKPQRLKGVPFQTVRALKEDKKSTPVDTPIQVTPFHWETVREKRHFRRYVQKKSIHHGEFIYFKQFGDPRTLCSHCGEYFKDDNALKQKGTADCEPATEILHDGAMHVPGSVYMLPRWTGTAAHVAGEAQAADYNLNFFINNTIPTGAFLVSGGQLAPNADKMLRDFIVQNVKGKLHRLLVLQAYAKGSPMPGGQSHNVKIEWVPMMSDRQTDGQFLEYTRHCEDAVARQFRLPGLLYGDSKQLNKATAWAALKFAEERVFQPLRREFDELMNRTLLPALGIKLWKFRTNAPETRDPTALSKIAQIGWHTGALDWDDLRVIFSDILSRELPPYDTDWSGIPYRALELGKTGEESDDETNPVPGDIDEVSDEDFDESFDEATVDRDATPDGGGNAGGG